MGGSNGAFEPGTVQVAQPYFISGTTGVIAAGLAAGAPVARLAQLGMILPQFGPAVQPTPIRISQIRMKLAPQTSPAGGAAFAVYKGLGTPAVGGTGAANHTPQRRKTTGYPAITAAETVLRVAGTDTLTAAGFTPDDATGPLDMVAVGVADPSGALAIWSPADLCGVVLEAGECLEVRSLFVTTGTHIALFAFDFLR